MSTTTPTPKKPPSSSGSGSTPNTARKAPAAKDPNRSPSRNATSATGTNTSSASITRTRSVRNGAAGTPASAHRARKSVHDPSMASSSSDEDAKAEMQSQLAELHQRVMDSENAVTASQRQTEVLQVKLDEALKEQGILDEQVHEHTERLEELENEKKELLRGKREAESIFESERAAMIKEREEAAAREEEMQRSLLRMKEALAQQRSGSLGLDGHEEGSWDSRRASRPLSISRTSSFRSGAASPNPEMSGGQFAPSGGAAGLQRSDSRSSSRLVMQKDKMIESLRLDLAEAQIKLVELDNKGGSNLQQLERQMYDIKMQNARLMEENESFQLLLRDKTLNGDFATSDLLRAPSTNGDSSRPSSRHLADGPRTSLADELGSEDASTSPDIDMAPDSATTVTDSRERRLQAEVSAVKDQNKALTLYINNIISRLLQHEQFEQILDKTPDLMAGPGAISVKYAAAAAAAAASSSDGTARPGSGVGVDMEKDLPPPPPPHKDLPSTTSPPPAGVEEPQSLLQRAGSVLRGRATKPPRPQSSMLNPDAVPKFDDAATPQTLNENPDTAPRIPLGRSTSTRAGGAHKRSNSDWPAASVVTNMYKGPSPGPTSPGLGSPVGAGVRGSFFPLGAGIRTASGDVVPSIDEAEGIDLGEGVKENQRPMAPPAESVGSRSRSVQRESITSAPAEQSAAFADQNALAALTGSAPTAPPSTSTTAGDVPSNPSSPPRSTAGTASSSSGSIVERDSRAGPAVMMGSKPRPLRLVQEAKDEKKSSGGAGGAGGNAANRGSWFGWMNKGVQGVQGAMPGRSVSGGEGGGQQQ